MAKVGTKTGTRLFYGDVSIDPATVTTALAGVREYGDMPGGEDIDEFETTELDAVNEDTSIDWTKKHEPAHEDPGHLVVNFTDDDALEVLLNSLKREHKAFKLLFVSGASQLIPDGWIKGVKRMVNGDGDWQLAVKIRVCSTPIFTPA